MRVRITFRSGLPHTYSNVDGVFASTPVDITVLGERDMYGSFFVELPDNTSEALALLKQYGSRFNITPPDDKGSGGMWVIDYQDDYD